MAHFPSTYPSPASTFSFALILSVKMACVSRYGSPNLFARAWREKRGTRRGARYGRRHTNTKARRGKARQGKTRHAQQEEAKHWVSNHIQGRSRARPIGMRG